jgi:hypothetical protein
MATQPSGIGSRTIPERPGKASPPTPRSGSYQCMERVSAVAAMAVRGGTVRSRRRENTATATTASAADASASPPPRPPPPAPAATTAPRPAPAAPAPQRPRVHRRCAATGAPAAPRHCRPALPLAHRCSGRPRSVPTPPHRRWRRDTRTDPPATTRGSPGTAGSAGAVADAARRPRSAGTNHGPATAPPDTQHPDSSLRESTHRGPPTPHTACSQRPPGLPWLPRGSPSALSPRSAKMTKGGPAGFSCLAEPTGRQKRPALCRRRIYSTTLETGKNLQDGHEINRASTTGVPPGCAGGVSQGMRAERAGCWEARLGEVS